MNAHASARAFRAAMEVMARPGRVTDLAADGPDALSPAAAALVLTLCDHETPVHLAGALDVAAVRDWLTFAAGAPLAPPDACAFALGRWADLPPLERFPAGTPEYPDRSATLIVEVEALDGPGATLTGPGIAGEANLPLPLGLAQARAAVIDFPLGLDLFLARGSRAAALPRSTRVG